MIVKADEKVEAVLHEGVAGGEPYFFLPMPIAGRKSRGISVQKSDVERARHSYATENGVRRVPGRAYKMNNGTQADNGTEYWVKIIPFELGIDSPAWGRGDREHKVASELMGTTNHDDSLLVRYHGRFRWTSTNEGAYGHVDFFVMEKLSETAWSLGSGDNMLRRHGWRLSMLILRDGLGAILELADLGFVHRDVHASNLALNAPLNVALPLGNQHLRLIDFDWAYRTGPQEIQTSREFSGNAHQRLVPESVEYSKDHRGLIDDASMLGVAAYWAWMGRSPLWSEGSSRYIDYAEHPNATESVELRPQFEDLLEVAGASNASEIERCQIEATADLMKEMFEECPKRK